MASTTANPMTLPEPSVINGDDGTKTIIEYRRDENGNLIKVTRRVRMTLHKQKAKHAVAERKHWNKFGAAASGKASFDEGITSLGEEVLLKLGVNKNFDKDESQQLTVGEQVKKLQSTKIICRVCKGEHWTTKCPYKDTLRPLESILDKSSPTSASMTDRPGSGSTSATGTKTDGKPAPTSGKYVPPSLRGKTAEPSASFPGGPSARRAEDETTIRVTNLSEDAREEDLSVLFKRFGPISRIFLARDRESGLCKGFAFINFMSRESASKAIEVMNGYGFDNLILNVEWSK